MKIKLRRIAGTVAFLLCGLLLFLPVSEVLRRKTAAETDMVHSFYEIEKDTLDVLFLGSSHLYYGVQPNELWKNQGIASYALGSPEQTAATAYFLLKEAFRYQQPRVVAMESYYLWYNGLYDSEARLRQAFDGMRLGPVKQEMIETMIPDVGVKTKLSYYIPFLKYHSRWSSLESYDFQTKPYLKGARLDYTVKELENPGLPGEAAGIPDISLEYLDKIIDLCREHDAQFVMFAIPFGIEKDQERYDRRQGLNLTLEQVLEEKGIPFLFYQQDQENLIDFSTDFRDKTHLNTAGAEKLSAHLGAWLSDYFALPDHRGEAAYSSWETDLAKYEADKANARENPVDTADDTE